MTIVGDTRDRPEGGAREVAAPWWRRAGTALFVAAILLPANLFMLSAWTGYRETMRTADVRTERTARVLEEHVIKVFETHRMVIQQVRQRLHFVDWSKESERAALHKTLVDLQDDLDQVTTITVVDADGRMTASGRTYPADPNVTFKDRDWFQGVRATRNTVISRAYLGRQSGQPVFNIAVPLLDDAGAFAGAIAVSIDRHYFETFYKEVEPDFDHAVTLIREDGEILARVPATNVTHLSDKSMLLAQIARSPIGRYRGSSTIDSVERIFAYRKIGSYPVYVRFGLSIDSVLAPWRRSLIDYGLTALLTSVALAIASWLALRQTARERLVRRRWQETAAALEAEVAERKRVDSQLRQMQKMEAIGRLTGGIAHDFNNLLTAVLGNLELAGRRVEDARVSRLLSNAVDGAQRAATLTSRLLAFSRQQPLQPTRTDVNALVAGMTELLRITLGENIAMRMQVAGDVWPVAIDASQLESAVLNLAVNARDAMARGGVLAIGTENMVVDDTSDLARKKQVDAGDYVMIRVADDGEGMTPEIMAQVFEPFFTTKPVGKGTGLGLSQVYGFARQSGGRVVILSTPGQGTTVCLYLPRLSEPLSVEVATPEPAVATSASRGETILIVEDEDMVRDFASSALRDAGYRVLEAADGPAALTLIAAHPEIALLFTDVVLKGPMDGRAVAQAASRSRDIPVLYTSGYARDSIIHDGCLEQGLDLLPKPFTTDELTARVRAKLDVTAPAQAAPAQTAPAQTAV